MRLVIMAILLILCTIVACDPTVTSPRRTSEVRPEFGTNAPDCWKFYNTPGQHKKWAECIGVGYVSD